MNKKENRKGKVKREKGKGKQKRESKREKRSLICYYSCAVFLSNILISFYYNYYIYSALFTLLIFTSLLHHSNPTLITNIIDKIPIVSIITYGGNIFYNKLLNIESNDIKRIIFSIIIIMTFLVINFWYIYGYYKNKYCFYENQLGFLYHMLVHIISSLGHILIVIL